MRFSAKYALWRSDSPSSVYLERVDPFVRYQHNDGSPTFSVKYTVCEGEYIYNVNQRRELQWKWRIKNNVIYTYALVILVSIYVDSRVYPLPASRYVQHPSTGHNQFNTDKPLSPICRCEIREWSSN